MAAHDSDEVLMRQALQEAQAAGEAGEVPVGCVVVCQGRIIARAHNLTERLNDVTAHAEMQAITAAAGYLGGKYLDECTLYVTVEPCPMCASAMYWAHLHRLVYGTGDPKRGYSQFEGLLHPATEVASGVLADDAAGLMKAFFRQKRD